MTKEEEEGGMAINPQGHVDDVNDNNNLAGLPPGFRFYPTDEEIVTCYLTEKMLDASFTAAAIGEADLNKSEPWDLPNKAKMGEKEWYFFCQRDRKYPTGMRTNRATESGYWKATGKDKEIFSKRNSKALVGMKKTLVFYTGRAPKGEKTNWVMHEYRLHGRNFSNASKDEWVVCRVFHKSMGMIKKTSSLSPTDQSGHLPRLGSFGDDFLETSSSSLPPLMDPTPSYQEDHSTSYHNNRFNYTEHNAHATTTKATLTTSTLSTPTDSPYYCHLGSNSTSFQLPNSYGCNQTLLFPQMNPNPSFSFHQDQYLRQEMMTSTPINIQDSYFNLFQSTPIDHQAILRGATHKNETSLTTLGSSGQCKVEQYSSNQSMFSVSQDTGLSTADMNVTDITSSFVSKPEMDVGSSNTLYEDHRSPYDAPFSEIEGLWDY